MTENSKRKAIAVSGMVSNMVGKEHVRSSNNRTGVSEFNASAAVEKLERFPSKNDGNIGNYRSYASVVSPTLTPSGSFENHINRITINLSGQSVEDGIYYLKKHLIFGVYCGTLVHLHVNTGYDGSDLKQAVTDLLDDEGIKWKQEEDPRCVLITFDREKKELKFNKGGRNSGYLILID
ncbi:unnamed protein product [Lactuca virosa]|uniref:Uncharacterized protein n=1 Tax=Lactuca virosa TaxID=75947 RepID=A0AAU9M1E6_9ASTR|nr:unnamed protein product [Lactuca virosa]